MELIDRVISYMRRCSNSTPARQDWDGLQSELVRLIADGRDVNDSAVFCSGTASSNQPNGITNGLSATNVVLTVGSAALAAGDIWSLKAAVPNRFQQNLTFAAPAPQFDRIYRLVGNGATAEAALFADGRNGPLVGRPIFRRVSSSVGAASLHAGGKFH